MAEFTDRPDQRLPAVPGCRAGAVRGREIVGRVEAVRALPDVPGVIPAFVDDQDGLEEPLAGHGDEHPVAPAGVEGGVGRVPETVGVDLGECTGFERNGLSAGIP